MTSTDENIKENIVESLCNEKQVDGSDITVKVQGGIVELIGTVSSSQAREIIETCAGKVPQVRIINNYVAVVKEPPDDPLSHVA